MADPVVEQPIVAPAVQAAIPQESTPSTPQVAAPAADLFGDAPAAIVAPVEAKPEPHPVEVPSLLETVGKKEEPKVEAKPADAVKPVDAALEAKPVEAAAPEVKPVEPPAAPEKVEWKFELPPTLKADDARMGRFTGILDNILTPKEGETRVQAGQRLLDLHNEAMTAYAEQTLANQIKAFNDTRAEWRKQVMADPKLGGSGHDTAMGAVARMRDLTISDAKPGTPQYETDAKEFNDFLRVTGAGDHPAYLRQLHRFARFIDEPPAPAAIGKPTPTNGIRPNRGFYADRKASPNGSAR